MVFMKAAIIPALIVADPPAVDVDVRPVGAVGMSGPLAIVGMLIRRTLDMMIGFLTALLRRALGSMVRFGTSLWRRWRRRPLMLVFGMLRKCRGGNRQQRCQYNIKWLHCLPPAPLG